MQPQRPSHTHTHQEDSWQKCIYVASDLYLNYVWVDRNKPLRVIVRVYDWVNTSTSWHESSLHITDPEYIH